MIHFAVGDVAPQRLADNVVRKPLLDDDKVPGIKFHLAQIDLQPGAKWTLAVAAADLACCQMLAGELALAHASGNLRLNRTQVALLPPAFAGTFASERGAAFLLALVPNAARLDPQFAVKPPALRVVDWSNEPLLESKHDARKRIYLVTPALFGTKAIKGEIIIYPPRTEAPNHYHVGAAHFMYFLKGSGTAFANERPFPVKAGDVVYFFDEERHALSAGEEEMTFAEFFVPAEVQTVWMNPALVCTWVPTGRNIAGGAPSRQIKEHSLAAPAVPSDV